MLRKLSIRAVLCALGLFVLALQADAQIIHFKLFLKNLDAGNYSFAYSLAAGGGIAGSSEQTSAGPNFETAVRWLSDAVLPQDLINGPVLVLPGPDYTQLGPGVAFGINDPFQAVGSYAYQVIGGADTFFGNRPFWSNGTFTTDLMVLDFDTDGGANAISNPMNPLDLLSSQVAGYSVGIDGTGFPFQRATRWNHLNNPASPLDLIPDPLDGFGGGSDTAYDIASDGVSAGSVTEFGAPGAPFATYWEAAPSTAMKFGWAAFDLSEAFSIVKTGGGDYILAGYMDDGATQRAALWVNPGNTAAGKNVLRSYGEPILTGAPTGADPDAHVVLLPLVPGMTAARAFDVYYDEFNGEAYVKGETYDATGVPYAFEWVSSDPTHPRLVTDFVHNGHSFDSATSANKVGSTIEFVGRATNLDPLATGPNKTKAFVATDDPVVTLTMSAGAVTPPATLTGTVTISNVPDATTYTVKLTKDHPNISIPSSVSITLPAGVHSGSARFRATVSALGAGTAPVGHIIGLMIDGNPLDAGFPFMRQRVVSEIAIGGWLKNIVVSSPILRPGQNRTVTVNLNKPAPFSGLNVPITLTTEVPNLLTMTFTAPSTGGGLSGNLFVPPGATSATFTLSGITGQGNITPNTPLGDDTSQKTYSLKATQGSTEVVTTGSVVKRWLDKVQIIGPDGAPAAVMSSGLAYKVRVILKAPATIVDNPPPAAHNIVVTNDQPGLYPFSPVPPGPGTLNLTVPVGAGSVDSAPFTVNTPSVPSTAITVTAFDTVDGNRETASADIRPLVKSFVITPNVIHTGDVAVGTLTLNSKITTTPTVTSSDPLNLTPGAVTSSDGGQTWNIALTHPNPVTVTEEVRLIASMLGQFAETRANLRPWLAPSPISGAVSFTGFNVPAGRATDFASPNSADVFRIVTVTLNDAPAGDVTVNLTASDPRVHIEAIDPTGKVPNGTNAVHFRLTADETTAGQYLSNLTATATKNGSTESSTSVNAVTVLPWLASMTPGSVSVPRGGNTTLTVGLSGKVPSLVFVTGLGTDTTIPIQVVSLNLSAGTVGTNPLVFHSGDQSLPDVVHVLTTTRARSFVVNASRSGTAKQTTVSIR